MREFLLYMGFSMLEICAMYYLIFKIFKIDILLKEFLFASVLMSFVSFVVRTEYELVKIDVIIQIVLMFLFLWLLCRIHIFYATLMTGMVYQAYFLIQTLYYLLMEHLGLFDSNIPYILSLATYTLQTLSAATALLIGWYVSYKKKGFDFVPDKPSGRIAVKRKEKMLFALNIPSIIIVGLTISFAGQFPQIFFIVPVCYALILYGYIYVSYKRDREET